MAEVEEIQDQFITPPQEEGYVDFNSRQVPSLYIDILQERLRTVRVILGQLGQLVRMSAPEVDIVTEGSTPEEAWLKFREEIEERFGAEERIWFSFDIGPTRREEIAEGLNAPEDEEWPELSEENEI